MNRPAGGVTTRGPEEPYVNSTSTVPWEGPPGDWRSLPDITLSAVVDGVETPLATQSVAAALAPGTFGQTIVFDLAVTSPVESLVARIAPVGAECGASNDEVTIVGPFCE